MKEAHRILAEKTAAITVTAAMLLGGNAVEAQQTYEETLESLDCDVPPPIEPVYATDAHTRFIENLQQEFQNSGSESTKQILENLTDYYSVDFLIGSEEDETTDYYNISYLSDEDIRQNSNFTIVDTTLGGLLKALEKYPPSTLPHMLDSIRIVKDIEGSVSGFFLKNKKSITLELGATRNVIEHELAHSLDNLLCKDPESVLSDYEEDSDFTDLSSVEYIGFSAYSKQGYYDYSAEYYLVGPHQEFASTYGMINVAEDRAETLEFITRYGLPLEEDPHYGSPFHQKMELLISRINAILPDFFDQIQTDVNARRNDQTAEDWYLPRTYSLYSSRLLRAVEAGDYYGFEEESEQISSHIEDALNSGDSVQILRGELVINHSDEYTDETPSQPFDPIVWQPNTNITIVNNPIIHLRGADYEDEDSISSDDIEFITLQLSDNSFTTIRYDSSRMSLKTSELTTTAENEETLDDAIELIQASEVSTPSNLIELNITDVFVDSETNLAFSYPVQTEARYLSIISQALRARLVEIEIDEEPEQADPSEQAYYSRRPS